MRSSNGFEKEQCIELGKFFAQVRYKNNKTQREVGAESGVGQAAVTNFERGKTDFQFSTLQRIANVYGYDVEIQIRPVLGGESIPAVPDPDFKPPRSYGEYAANNGIARRRAMKKNPEPQLDEDPYKVKYEKRGEFDTEREMAALRAKFGIKS